LGSYLLSRNVRISLLGDTLHLSDDARRHLTDLAALTESATGLHLRLALAYSGRRDLVNAARSIALAVAEKRLAQSEITEGTIASQLSTATAPDPELLIRTGGNARLSDFLLYNLAYTDIVIEDALWPEFSHDRFRQIVEAWRTQKAEPYECGEHDRA
jgi:undecaprenyl diphosphate synthase